MKIDQNERIILPKLYHSFIVNLHYAFQSSTSLFFVLDYMEGGNLRKYMDNDHTITETECKFIAACILEALRYLCDKEIIHHDIKPENLVFDDRGYLRLTDFGISQKNNSRMKLNRSGTLSYIAPEIMFGQAYSYNADYFSLGIILHEMIEDHKPLSSSSREDLMDDYIHKKIIFQNPKKWSADSIDFASKLLIKTSDKRIGKNGIAQLLEHSWLKCLNWNNLREKKMVSPCLQYLEPLDQSEELTIRESYSISSTSNREYVDGFYYERENSK